MSNKHEREPWVLGGCSGRMVTTPSGYVGDGFIADVDTKDNARRIVACVNACRGLPTEELEQKGIVAAVGTQLLAADDRAEGQEREIRRLAGIAADAENQLAEARNLSDELLAALNEAVETIEWMHGCSSPARNEVEEAIQDGLAAIAKAKGGAA